MWEGIDAYGGIKIKNVSYDTSTNANDAIAMWEVETASGR